MRASGSNRRCARSIRQLASYSKRYRSSPGWKRPLRARSSAWRNGSPDATSTARLLMVPKPACLPWPASRRWSSARARSTRHTRPMSTLRCRNSKRAAPSSTGSLRIRAPNLGSCMRYRAAGRPRDSGTEQPDVLLERQSEGPSRELSCDYFQRSKAGIKAVFNVTAMERSILAELFERGGRGQLSGLRDRRPIERLVNKGFVERHTLNSQQEEYVLTAIGKKVLDNK